MLVTTFFIIWCNNLLNASEQPLEILDERAAAIQALTQDCRGCCCRSEFYALTCSSFIFMLSVVQAFY